VKPINTAWRARLNGYAERIDALSLRERAIVFLSLAAVLAALMHSLLIAPLNERTKRQLAAQTKQNAELQALRDQFSIASGASRGDAETSQLQQRLATALQSQTQLRRAVELGFQGLGGQGGLRELLATLLRQHARLSLVRLVTLDSAPAAFSQASDPSPAASAGGRELQWRGIEMQISGNYLDQQQYLLELERAVPKLHWGEMRVWSQGDRQPVLLQIQLYVPKEQP